MKKVLLIIVLLPFLSCSKNESTNKNIIPKENLAEIIADIQKAQSLVNIKEDSNMTVRNIRQKQYNEDIFHKHNISEEKYNKSIEYYSSNQKEFTLLLDMVSKKLN
ncbi:MAG: DUF4296 domain-containing protein [Bacteroidales bacterium]|jgi:hypothetical protein|nr:DUF4296 domain-containing protein [Bacteroidales bacterium]